MRLVIAATLAMLGVVGCTFLQGGWGSGNETPDFVSARPVWPEGRETEMNLFVGFRARFDGREGNRAVLRLTGASVYRIFLNGEFLGYGPARGPHGHDRVDEWPLKGCCRRGENILAIEVAGYNINSYYLLDQPAYLQAELVAGRKVLAHTAAAAAEGNLFEAGVLPHRVQKAQRYSFQRPFAEIYRQGSRADEWRIGGALEISALAVSPQRELLPRIAPYPSFPLLPPVRVFAEGTAKFNPARKLWAERGLKNVSAKLKGFPEAELALIPTYDVQRLETAVKAPLGIAYEESAPFTLRNHQFRILEFERNSSGFIRIEVACEAPVKLYLVFDEVLVDGDVDITRYHCANVVTYELDEAGEYTLESFEPYQLKYLKVLVEGGACQVGGVALREYANPDTGRARFECSDPVLNSIFEAARETFRQNAVDAFTDCAGRERAGWLCDSFFTARVAADLCGNTDMERMFLQNYLLPHAFEFLPEGMLPMCYPADHNDGNFIPNWAMWFVIELEEYLWRSGDRAMIEALKPRVLALLEWFKKYENSDGLLEKLPGWVFVEWSHANKLVQDVNYPSNMTYAEVLARAGRLYDLPELLGRAETLRATIRHQSFDGEWFVDNAVRQPDGSLKLSGERTETCQYYAFFFHTATPQTHAALWQRLRDDFGPSRRQSGKFPDIHFSNAFIGNYLRLELLSREGLAAQILEETKGFFQKMDELTGTLWENDTTTASCNHGFASHVVRLYYRDVLGVREIDTVNRRVKLRFADVQLTHCRGEIPIGGQVLRVAWRRDAQGFHYDYKAPRGFRVEVE